MMINGIISQKTEASQGKREIPGLLGITEDILLYRGRDIMRIILYYRSIEKNCFGMAGFTNCGDGRTFQVFAGGRWEESEGGKFFREEVSAMEQQGWKPLQDVFSILRCSNWGCDQNKLFDSSKTSIIARTSVSVFNEQAQIVSVVPLGANHVIDCIESDFHLGLDCGASYFIFGSTLDTASDRWMYDIENKYGERVICSPKNFKFNFKFDDLFFPPA